MSKADLVTKGFVSTGSSDRIANVWLRSGSLPVNHFLRLRHLYRNQVIFFVGSLVSLELSFNRGSVFNLCGLHFHGSGFSNYWRDHQVGLSCRFTTAASCERATILSRHVIIDLGLMMLVGTQLVEFVDSQLQWLDFLLCAVWPLQLQGHKMSWWIHTWTRDSSPSGRTSAYRVVTEHGVFLKSVSLEGTAQPWSIERLLKGILEHARACNSLITAISVSWCGPVMGS